jgi:hypothetical protein
MPVYRLRVAAMLIALVSISAAQSPDEPPPRKKTPIPSEGFWPTRKLMERVIDRISDEVANIYDMDEEQKLRTRKTFKEKVIPWADENRGELMTVTNEFYETLFGDEAPSPEQVADWAARVLPLVEDFNEVAIKITDDMRDYMTDDQITRLDGEFAAFQTGLSFVQGKLGTWREGGYDPEAEWIGPAKYRNEANRERDIARAEAQEAAMRAEMDAARDAAIAARESHDAAIAPGTPPPSPRLTTRPATSAAVTDEWVKYTESFIKRYELDVDQQQLARAALRVRQEERDAYLTRKSADLERVAEQGKKAKTDEEKKAAREAFEKLDAPVQRMFAQLRDKLDRIPTRAQRKAAAERDAPASAATQSAPASAPAGGTE